jgi:hypothetical protein
MRNWRVGIEARISQLKRSFGLRRTRLRRLDGARSWVGLGIFAYNLQRMTVIARGVHCRGEAAAAASRHSPTLCHPDQDLSSGASS